MRDAVPSGPVLPTPGYRVIEGDRALRLVAR